MGILDEGFVVLKDEAISGATESRPAFDKLKDLIYSGRLGILVVTEQSRVSRGDNVKSFVKDIVFHGGRFISLSEGIDTDRKGWKLIVGISEIHHSTSSDDTAERVRGGQAGRVRDGNGSAGDFCYGYKSEYEAPAAALAYRGRGPKPKKRVLIDEAAAAVVRQVFIRFAINGDSISSIVRWWELNKGELPLITRNRIHHQHVRRILMNKKYSGIWTFGATVTLYDGSGRKKQVPAPPSQVVAVDRPSLRIIDSELWDRAQVRLAELKAVFGMKPGGKKRGVASDYRLLYEKSLLGGQVTCGRCGARLHSQYSGQKKQLKCPNHRVGKCTMAMGMPYRKAERAVLELITQLCKSQPKWLQEAIDDTRRRLDQLAQEMPTELVQVQQHLQETSLQVDRLVDTLAGGIDSPAIRARLRQLEGQKYSLETKVAQLQQVQVAQLEMPNDSWIREQLDGLTDLFSREMSTAAPYLRPLLRRVVFEPVVAPGKMRGYGRLRVTVDGWAVLAHMLAAKLPAAILEKLKPAEGNCSEEFVLDLGVPSRMDKWAPAIVQWRQEKVKWTEICRRTGLNLANAYKAYKRHKEANQAK